MLRDSHKWNTEKNMKILPNSFFGLYYNSPSSDDTSYSTTKSDGFSPKHFTKTLQEDQHSN